MSKKENRERLSLQESLRFLSSLPDYQNQIHAHGYDPGRICIVDGEEIFNIKSSNVLRRNFPDVPDELGWTEAIYRTTYQHFVKPILQDGIDNPRPLIGHGIVNGHWFGSLRDWTKVHHPEAWEAMQNLIRSDSHPIIDSYIHAILPIQHPRIRKLLIKIGIRAFEDDYDLSVSTDTDKSYGFWPGELAVSQPLIDTLAENNIDFLILGRNQINTSIHAPIYKIPTQSGKYMYIFIYDKELSSKLAFHKNVDAQKLANDFGYTAICQGFAASGAADMETFGHWNGNNSLYALNFLAHKGLPALSQTFGRTADHIVEAKVYNSSWSCWHHAFSRWTGRPNCDCDGADDQLREQKRYWYNNLYKHQIHAIKQLDIIDDSWEQVYIDWFLSQRIALATGQSIDSNTIEEKYRSAFIQLFVSMIGMTSCGWFFGTSSDFERQIPINCLGYLEKHYPLPTPTATTTTTTAGETTSA
ncbi:hypothetical protein ACFL1P_01195 [Patescibacteria group bacterium]